MSKSSILAKITAKEYTPKQWGYIHTLKEYRENGYNPSHRDATIAACNAWTLLLKSFGINKNLHTVYSLSSEIDYSSIVAALEEFVREHIGGGTLWNAAMPKVKWPSFLLFDMPGGDAYHIARDLLQNEEFEWSNSNLMFIRIGASELVPSDMIKSSSFDVLRISNFKKLSTETVCYKSASGISYNYPFLGVELEVESKNDRIEAGKKILKDLNGSFQSNLPPDKVFAILKTDGSLDSYKGIEIVSCPATLGYHKHGWAKFFSHGGACKLVNSWEHTNNRCGLHIHISRNSFTGLTLGRFERFINHPDNNKFVTQIAGRDYTHYAKFAPEKKITDGIKPGKEKYEAVNKLHANSIEVRIFKGNVNEVGFFKSLEFVAALREFSIVTSNTKLHYNDFTAWLVKNPHEYPNLIYFLMVWGFIDKDKLPNNIAIDIQKIKDKRTARIAELKSKKKPIGENYKTPSKKKVHPKMEGISISPPDEGIRDSWYSPRVEWERGNYAQFGVSQRTIRVPLAPPPRPERTYELPS